MKTKKQFCRGAQLKQKKREIIKSINYESQIMNYQRKNKKQSNRITFLMVIFLFLLD